MKQLKPSRILVLTLTLSLSLLSACHIPQINFPQTGNNTTSSNPNRLVTSDPNAKRPPAIPEFTPQVLPSARPGSAGSRGEFAEDSVATAPAAAPGGFADGGGGGGGGSAGSAEASRPASSSSSSLGKSAPSFGLLPRERDSLIEEPGSSQQQPQSGLLTAGAWDDIAHWSFWTDLLKDPQWQGHPKTWGLDTSKRIEVKVTGANGPLADVPVQLVNPDNQQSVFEARTNSNGVAHLYAGLLSPTSQDRWQVKAGLGEEVLSKDVLLSEQSGPVALSSQLRLEPATFADLMLMVDTTGSMGDELEYLKQEMQNVAERITKLNRQDLQLRLSANFYRDLTDQYVVRPFPFTDNFSTVNRQLSEQSAGGGGDFPEAVDVALADAVDNHQWSATARARLLFLVLDAPPHQDQENLQRLHTSLTRMAAKGIRIIPIASSGIDKETEFLLRMLAITSGGQYVFLTDDSGIGNSHLKPTIGQYSVEKLNDLMVRIATEYIAGNTEAQQAQQNAQNQQQDQQQNQQDQQQNNSQNQQQQ